MRSMRTWQDASSVDTGPLDGLGLNPVVARALVRRGVASAEAARAFMDPSRLAPTSPLELAGMESAVARITGALEHHESICIWGDFDVDGQTSTTVLVQALGQLGGHPGYHVPLRATEGHGVDQARLASIIDRGAQLIVTCDTGITAHAAVDYARSRGVDFVITDHHELGPILPSATAVVDPRLLPPEHPLANLAGVGVAYELARALLEARGLDPRPLLDLVALGLVADVALLRAETRGLAQQGIQVLRTTSRRGLQTLAALARTDLLALTEETIGFELAPRLNAVGRLGDANQAVELLLTEDGVRANVLAAQIEGLNIRRRLLTEQVYSAAQEQLHSDPSLLSRPILMLTHPSWPGGVLGIVASQLVEQYQKPAFLLSASEDGRLHGSARSIEGLDITAAIAANASDLQGFGGHPMAAGVSLDAASLPKFQRNLEATVEKVLAEAHIPEAALTVDEWLPLDQLSLDLADELATLAPFGAGNPSLVFATADVHLVSSRDIGRAAKHRRLSISDEQGVKLEVLWWNSREDDLPRGKFDLAYSIRASTFGGERQLSVELRDLRPAAETVIEVTAVPPEVVDFRLQPSAAQLPGSCLIWAEGAPKSGGNNRLSLHESTEFAIWTTPPSRSDLRAALALVKPRKIYLVGIDPPDERAEAFIARLAGMAKYALNHRYGKVALAELAAVTAQRELTVRLGLEWLAANGDLRVQEDEQELLLVGGNSARDNQVQAELMAGIRSLLAETAAYREYFARAVPEALLEL